MQECPYLKSRLLPQNPQEREDLDIHDNTSLTVGHLQGVVADFASLFAEDCTQQAFFCGQFRFALRGDLTNQNIAGMYFRTDADNTVS